MKEAQNTLSAGLYLVATPIGAAQDITLRALDVIRSADIIAAEDTRITRKLMSIHGIPRGGRKLISYNDHSGRRQMARILELLTGGKSVCLLADAGSPMIADPGLRMAQEAASAGVPVVSKAACRLRTSGTLDDRTAILLLEAASQTVSGTSVRGRKRKRPAEPTAGRFICASRFRPDIRD